MTRATILLFALLLASCSSAEKERVRQEARHKFGRELANVEIKGNPIDLTVRMLDQAYYLHAAELRNETDEEVRKAGKSTLYSVGETPGFKVVIGEKIYPKFREKFVGEGFMWRDQLVEMTVALNSSDIKVVGPTGVFELKSRGGDGYAAYVTEKKGLPEKDALKARARLVRALDSSQFSKVVGKIKKQYPDFEL